MKLSSEIERYRCKEKPFVSEEGQAVGLFYIPYKSHKLMVIICHGGDTGWDHVSVSLKNRPPNWSEMCFVKKLFFDEEETVVQFHPKKSEYVNNHPHCLHLWRSTKAEHELPPFILTGIKRMETSLQEKHEP